MTIPEVLEEAARRFSSRIAVQTGSARLTYEELYLRSRQVAGALTEMVQPRDIVLLIGRNGPDTTAGLLGTILTGAIPVPVPPDMTAAEVLNLVTTLRPTLVLAKDESLQTAAQLPLPILPLHIDASPATTSWPTDPNDTALLRLTSGSTGGPKAIELSHRACVWRPLTRHYGPGERHLWPLPNRMTLEKIFPVIRSGGTLIYTNTIEPGEILATLAEAEVTYLWAVPPILRVLVDHVRLWGRPELPHLWGASSGAAPMNSQLHHEFEAAFGVPLHEHYGMSEGDVCVQNPVGAVRHGSVGCPLPGAEVEVVDTDGAPLPPGEVGEIRYRSPGLMNGYYGRPNLTAQMLKGGWLYTQDLGWLDQDGYLHLTGRIKELINIGGLKVVPADVERVLLEDPTVAMAAVFGVPDPARGEVVAACVVPRQGGAVDIRALRHRVREHLSPHKRPRSFWVLPQFPLNASGKIDKVALLAAWIAQFGESRARQRRRGGYT
ncbi:MAG TPA: AMP-binding protein [Symbiobacteriaceae bacterium]|nr:AMP-binding protein [Symbiobacteriaceae bacterium]